jgi:hypothetical protein
MSATPLSDSDLHAYLARVATDPLFLGNPDLLARVEWVADGSVDRLVKKRAAADGEAEEAVVRFVGELAAESYWLYPCAGWNGPGAFNTPFTKAKANGRVRPGREKVSLSMWKATESGARAVMDSKKTAGFVTNLQLLDLGSVRIRHSIWEVCGHAHVAILS